MRFLFIVLLSLALSFSLKAQTYQYLTNGIYTESNVCSGVFVDGGGDAANYSNNEDYTVTFVSSAPDKVIRIDFESFNTEVNDVIYVYDGESNSDYLLLEHSGSIIPRSITSTGSYLTVRFVSNSSLVAEGFKINISCADSGFEIYDIGNYNGQTIQTCNAKFYDAGGLNGTFSAGNRTVTFQASAGTQLKMDFQSFSIGSNDQLKIYDANTSTNLIGTYESTTNPGQIISSSGYLTVELTTVSANEDGWEAYITCVPVYEITQGGNQVICNGIFTDQGGMSGNYSNDQDYEITLSSGSSDKLALKFSQLNIENGYDFLEIYDGPTTSSTLLYNLSGTSIPDVIFSSGSELTFHFTSDYSQAKLGWVAAVNCISNESYVLISDGGSHTINNPILFYDTGGPFGTYGKNENYNVTFCAPDAGQVVTADFQSFAIESGYDFISFYNGTGTSDYIAGYTDAGQLSVSSDQQCMTVNFRSDGGVQMSGWKALITAGHPLGNDDPVGATELSIGKSCSGSVYNNIKASNSSQPDPSCGGLPAHSPSYLGGDMWYYFNVPDNGFHIQTIEGSLKGMGLAIYNAAYNELYCDGSGIYTMPEKYVLADDYAGLGISTGDKIYVRLWGWNKRMGTFEVCANELPLSDPLVATALTVGIECNPETFSNASIVNGSAYNTGADGCGYNSGSDADIWFKFNMPVSGKVKVLLNEISIRYSNMALFSGSPATSLSLEACQNTSGDLEYLTGTPGSLVYLRVWSNKSEHYKGDFGLCIFDPFPENDLPQNASELIVNAYCQDETYGLEYATDSQTDNTTVSSPSCTWSGGDKDLWYYFEVPASKRVNIELSGNQKLNFSLYKAENIAGLLTATNECADADYQSNLSMSLPSSGFSLSDFDVGDRFYLRVWQDEASVNTSLSHEFSLCAYQPAADDACTAGELPVSGAGNCNYSYFSTESATKTVDPDNTGLSCNYSANLRDVWFKATVPASGRMIIDSKNGFGGTTIDNSVIAVYSGSCDNLSLLSCDESSSDNTNMGKISLTSLTPGNNIYIRVWGADDAYGAFGICVTDPCAQLEVVNLQDTYCSPDDAGFTVQSKITPVILGEYASFTVSGGLPLTNYSDGSADINVLSASTGSYDLTCTYTSGEGCVTSVSESFQIVEEPNITGISISGDEEVCQGAKDLIYEVNTVLNADYYTWSVEGPSASFVNILPGASERQVVISVLDNATFDAVDDIDFKVVLKLGNTCKEFELVKGINIYKIPSTGSVFSVSF